MKRTLILFVTTLLMSALSLSQSINGVAVFGQAGGSTFPLTVMRPVWIITSLNGDQAEGAIITYRAYNSQLAFNHIINGVLLPACCATGSLVIDAGDAGRISGWFTGASIYRSAGVTYLSMSAGAFHSETPVTSPYLLSLLGFSNPKLIMNLGKVPSPSDILYQGTPIGRYRNIPQIALAGPALLVDQP